MVYVLHAVTGRFTFGVVSTEILGVHLRTVLETVSLRTTELVEAIAIDNTETDEE